MAHSRALVLSLLAAAFPGMVLAQQPAAPAAQAPAPAQTQAQPQTQPQGQPRTPAQPSAPADPRADLPPDAPKDDYELTAWCYGLIRQHLELYPMVRPELEAISRRLNSVEADAKLYADTLTAHQQVLVQLGRALEAAERASPRTLVNTAQRARDLGRRKWDGIASVDKSSQAYSWMSFGVPEGCVRTASALETRSLLFGQALQANVPPPSARPPAAAPATTRPASPPAASPPAATATQPAPSGAAPAATPPPGPRGDGLR